MPFFYFVKRSVFYALVCSFLMTTYLNAEINPDGDESTIPDEQIIRSEDEYFFYILTRQGVEGVFELGTAAFDISNIGLGEYLLKIEDSESTLKRDAAFIVLLPSRAIGAGGSAVGAAQGIVVGSSAFVLQLPAYGLAKLENYIYGSDEILSKENITQIYDLIEKSRRTGARVGIFIGSLGLDQQIQKLEDSENGFTRAAGKVLIIPSKVTGVVGSGVGMVTGSVIASGKKIVTFALSPFRSKKKKNSEAYDEVEEDMDYAESE